MEYGLWLGISKGCNTILQNFQERSFVFFSRISKGKVTNLKFSRDFFSQKYVLNPSLDFFGITHYDSSVNDMV